ncbi:MAG TPA: hypothetical protein VNN72_27440 [Polyangiaceae bacterium]|nr:hypothetical protein [Polyangiaceae bacterium]
MRSLLWSSLFLAAAALGCASPAAQPAETDASLSTYVLDAVPTDVQNRTLIDFGGAVHLVGYDLSPADKAAPGSTLHLKLYWRSVKKLSPGWSLFTHVVSADAPKPYAFDNVGALRQAVSDATLGTKQKLSPSDFIPGKVYVDEQDIVVPQVAAPEVTLAVGIGREAVQLTGKEIERLAGSRLEILSGISDGQDRAVIARLATGVVPGQKNDPRGERRRPGDRRPGPPGAGRDRPGRPSLPTLMPGRPTPRPEGSDLKEKP